MSANITVNIADFTQEPLSITKVQIKPLFQYSISGDSIITGDRLTKTTDATGIVVFNEVVIGAYEAEFLGPYKTTSVTFVVSESGDFNLKDLIDTPITLPDGNVAYSKAAADARFALKSEVTGGGTSYTFSNEFALLNNAVSLSNTVKNMLTSISTKVNSENSMLAWDDGAGYNWHMYQDEPGLPVVVEPPLALSGTLALNTTTPNTVLISNGSRVLSSSSITTTKLGFLSDVTANIQSQIETKAPLINPTLTNPTFQYNGISIVQDDPEVLGSPLVVSGPLNAESLYAATGITVAYGFSSVPVIDAIGRIIGSSVSPTELSYLDGVTSSIQTQLNAKAPLNAPTFTGRVYAEELEIGTSTQECVVILDANGRVSSSDISLTELSYLDGVTSSIQTQFNTITANAQNYTTVTPSAGTVTIDFASTPEQYLNLSTNTALTFAISNPPASKVANVTLYINNTSASPIPLTFPGTWKALGSTFPTSLAAGKNAMLWLRYAVGTTSGTFNAQL